MTSYSFLDKFPAEILHIVFNYIPIPELYHRFHNVSDYVTAVLLSYPLTSINLKSFTQYHSEFLYQHIKPEELLSLTLYDDIDKSGQSELFLSYFHIEQFIRLRSLTLIDIEYTSLNILLSNLNKLLSLRSLSFITTKHYRLIDKIYRSEFVKIKTNLINNCQDLLPKLNQLTLYNVGEMQLKLFSHLRHLKLLQCSTIELQTICTEVPKLKSLDICFQGDPKTIANLSGLSTLTRLNLEFDVHEKKPVSMDIMEGFLPQLIQLKHLELQVLNDNNFDDGNRWKKLTKSLMTFNFKFRKTYSYTSLSSFRTPYWSQDKKWFVIYSSGDYCTIPYFAPEKIQMHEKLSIILNPVNQSLFYENVTDLTILEETFDESHFFPCVKTLKLDCSVSIEKLSNVIDFKSIKHLILSSKISISMFLLMLPLMSCLNQLTLPGRLIPVLIYRLKDKVIEQIESLTIDFCYFENDSVTQTLCQCFPRVKYLTVSLICSIKNTLVFTEEFNHLLNASFGLNSLNRKNKAENYEKLKILTDKKYNCQIVHSSNQNTFSFIHLWRNDHQSLPSFLETIK